MTLYTPSNIIKTASNLLEYNNPAFDQSAEGNNSAPDTKLTAGPGEVVINEDNFVLLQINITRENTVADNAMDAIIGAGDYLLGTDVAAQGQFDVAIYMDDTLVDVMPYNESMRDYVFQVEKNSLHTLVVQNANTKEGQLAAEQFSISENMTFAYQVNTSAGNYVYLEPINPNLRYDYLEDTDFILTGLVVTAGTFFVVKKINESGIFEDNEEIIAQNKAREEEYVENQKKLREAEAIERKENIKKEIKEEMERSEYNSAVGNYNYLKRQDPYEENLATQRAHDLVDYLAKEYQIN